MSNDPYLHSADQKLVLQVKSDLDRQEGFREFAYPDPLSKLNKSQPSKRWGFEPAKTIAKPGTNLADGNPWTVGYGDTLGVTPETRTDKIKAERRLEQHILESDNRLRRALPWYADATFVTKTILINMEYNMGLTGLLGFRNTLQFIKDKNYTQAAKNMEASLWYRQVKGRAVELVERMKTQTIPDKYKAPERIR